MSQLTRNLLAWADELDSGRWQQQRGRMYGRSTHEACVIGCALAQVGLTALMVRSNPWDEFKWFARLGEHLGVDAFSTPIQSRIVAEVIRVAGLEREVVLVRWLSELNDIYGVDFPTFARAIRTVARQLEEEEFGMPIEVVEPALAEVAS